MSKVAYTSNIWGGTLPASTLTFNSTAYGAPSEVGRISGGAGGDAIVFATNGDGSDGASLFTIGDSSQAQGGAHTTSKLEIVSSDDVSTGTVFVSRTSDGADVDSDIAVVRTIGVAGSTATAQQNGVISQVLAYNDKDTVAIFGTAQANSTTSTAFAYGGFFQAYAFGPNSRAIAIQTDVQNETGTAAPYTQTNFGNKFVGIDLVFDTAASGKDSGCAIQFRQAGGSAWDVGLGFQGIAVKTSLVDNDTDCVRLWKDTGAHTDGFDLSGATFSGNAYKSTGFSVDGSGNLTALSLSESSGTWTSFTSTATAGTGAITTQSSASKYKQIGKTVFVSIVVSITNVGTGSGTLSLTLPVNAGGTMVLVGRENGTSGKVIQGIVGNGSSTLSILNYDNTNPSMANGSQYVLTGVYMSQ